MDKEFEYKHFTLHAHVKYDKETIKSINLHIFEWVSDGWIIDHYDTACSEEFIHKFYILKKPIMSNKISES
jgi:hypothetical protein